MPTSGRTAPLSHFGPPTAPKNTASDARQASRVSSGYGSPTASIAAPPKSCSVNSSEKPWALAAPSSTRIAACVTSGPIPSPGRTVIV